MRATQRKGDIATTRAVATFTEMGYDVAIPLTESAAYDLIVDDGDGLHRVQCKYVPDSYDWWYVLRPDGREYLYKECHVGRRSVTPTAKHLIGGVAESG